MHVVDFNMAPNITFTVGINKFADMVRVLM